MCPLEFLKGVEDKFQQSSFGKATSIMLIMVLGGMLFAARHACALPSGFVDELVATGLSRPLAMAFAPDGRLFITEQGGSVRVLKGGALLSTPFAKLNVDSELDRGLLGLAFHPNFPASPYLFVYHTVPGASPTLPSHNRITRFEVSGDVAKPGSATTILDLDNLSLQFKGHQGGAIYFGKDGKLYVAVGDNHISSNAQSLLTRLGKMLRINVDGSIPSDNPSSFPGVAGSTVGVYQSIWAVGLRNPFTFDVQPDTGKIFINDVGEAAYEEIDPGVSGANYGWPTVEGPSGSADFVNPTYAYTHQANAVPQGCAISGGAFYNPSLASFPSAYIGKYFFADYCSSWIYYVDPLNPGTPTLFTSGLNGPQGLTVGPEGALYYLQQSDGRLRRIRYTGTVKQAMVVSANQLDIGEGANAVVLLRLAKKPTTNVQVSISRGRSDPSVSSTPASVTFTPTNWNISRSVTISAAQDSDNLDGGATIFFRSSGLPTVQAWVTAVDNDRPAGSPRAIIAFPRNADVVSGTMAEFFGNGPHDGSLSKAEFYIDGKLRYTDPVDPSEPGHFHFNGGHRMWNTTGLSNGTHLLTMRVYDKNGSSGGHTIRAGVSN